jgi:hypothetical protein
MLVAVLAVLVAVFFVATGRGGELSHERPDHAPLDVGPVSASDVALLRPPTAMWGYNVDVTDEALDLIAGALRDRDVTIAYLQQQLAERSAGTVPDPSAAPRPGPARPDPRYLQPWSDWRTPAPGQDPAAERGPAEPAEPADSGDPASRPDPAAEDDLVPWDQPAGTEDLRAEEDPGAGPAGHEGPPGEPGQ